MGTDPDPGAAEAGAVALPAGEMPVEGTSGGDGGSPLAEDDASAAAPTDTSSSTEEAGVAKALPAQHVSATLGRDGDDYRSSTSAGGSPRRSRWRPPTPERGRRGRGRTRTSASAGTSGMLSSPGGGDADSTVPSPGSWLGGVLSSLASPSSPSSPLQSDASSAADFAVLDTMRMHPEQLATDAAIARKRAGRLQQKGRGGSGGQRRGDRKRSKLLQPREGGGGGEPYAGAGDEFEFEDEPSTSAGTSTGPAEERVRAECSFFYTGMDDDPTRARTRVRSRARGYRRGRRGGFGAADGDDDFDGGEYHGRGGGLYYAASGDDGAMGLDLEAGRGGGGGGGRGGGDSSYTYGDAGERDAFLARHERLNAHVRPPPSRHGRDRGGRGRSRFGVGAGGIHTAVSVLPGDDHDLRLDQDQEDGGASAAPPAAAQSPVSSSRGTMRLDDAPASPSSAAFVSDSLRQSSLLYIHAESGRVQLRLPTDSVRLLMDAHLEPGILSVERVRVGVGVGVGEDGFASLVGAGIAAAAAAAAVPAVPQLGMMSRSRDDNEELDAGTGLEKYPANAKFLEDGSEEEAETTQNLAGNTLSSKGSMNKCPWKEEELHYVLTVDDDLYRRLVKEMADSRTLCGIYYCCHTTEGEENRVSIGVALCVLFVVFTLLLVETIIHPH